jgi:hypothetical protein
MSPQVVNYGPSPVDKVKIVMALPYKFGLRKYQEAFLEIFQPKVS